jgi:hypothetical protein
MFLIAILIFSRFSQMLLWNKMHSILFILDDICYFLVDTIERQFQLD